ncbi:manganese catalase family protein, partial [Micromonospora sp. M51]|uniref:manganese catalase family protein n=1 Tax=Micromonospora sp. M51 TaxID=2824889 RepID=UPI001B391C05
MFSHVKDLQFEAKPDGPDAAFARRLQEVLGGKWGEMTVANQYLFQGWNCRLPGKYKDLLLDVGTEEMGHVEMIVTMITRLVDNAPLTLTEGSAADPGGAA